MVLQELRSQKDHTENVKKYLGNIYNIFKTTKTELAYNFIYLLIGGRNTLTHNIPFFHIKNNYIMFNNTIQ